MITGLEVRAIRRMLGINQTELAELVGLKQATISNYERDRWRPSVCVEIRLRALKPAAPAAERMCKRCLCIIAPNLPCGCHSWHQPITPGWATDDQDEEPAQSEARANSRPNDAELRQPARSPAFARESREHARAALSSV